MRDKNLIFMIIEHSYVGDFSYARKTSKYLEKYFLFKTIFFKNIKNISFLY
jgi:hypothetical protein